MSFRSMKYSGFTPATGHTWRFEDSDFGIVEFGPSSSYFNSIMLVAQEYIKRRLDPCRAVAILMIKQARIFNNPVESIGKLQDEYFPKYIPNWKDFIPGRNEWLVKILLIE